MAIRIFGWMADSTGCGHYRIALPLAEYVRRGGQARWSEEMTAQDIVTSDIIVGQRVCRDDATLVWQAMCAKGDKLMVLEIDDDLFQIDPSNAPAYKFYTPSLLANLAQNIRAAHVVTVSTEPLADVIRAYNPNVVVVPNRIPAWLLEHQRPVDRHRTIGWGGGVSHAMDWVDAAPQVARFLQRNQDVHAHVIGGTFESMRNWPVERLTVTPWFNSVDDYYRAVNFDIGLAPLRPHVFNQSKSAIKTLEYAALGIPVVASAAGPYEEFVQHGVTGLLVRRDHEWTSHLRALANDADMRMEMDRNARQQAAEHTIEGNLGSWLEAWQVPAMEAAA